MDLNTLKEQILKNAGQNKQFHSIDNPITLQDKINWLKVYDNTQLKTKCADKILLHEYSKEKLGKDICVPILKIYNDANDIILDELPDKFVLKCNHGWNMVIICTDKNKLDLCNSIKKLNYWKTIDFGKKTLQLHYSDIVPQIYAEKYLTNGNYLIDYKFWCFHGEPQFYTINSDNGHQNSTDIIYYNIKDDSDMEVYKKTLNNVKYNKPTKFNEMVEYARKLSADFKFVRVDFYEVDDIIYLGELTFTPGNGYFQYKNEDIAIKLGKLLNL